MSAEFVLQLLQLLECMVGSDNLFAKEGVFKHPIMDKFQLGEDQSWSKWWSQAGTKEMEDFER